MIKRYGSDECLRDLLITDFIFILDGPSARTSEVVVVVDILDISEHPPVFLMSNYTAVVYENSAVGTIVLVVETNDRDTVSQCALIGIHRKVSSSLIEVNAFDRLINRNHVRLL